jgi:LytS/YehU family sensor histidine kinase
MLAALRAAELRRAGAQQSLAQVSLGTLQARIDPEFVFGTLSKLEQLYASDPAQADRLLDELIAFLRRALADLRPI